MTRPLCRARCADVLLALSDEAVPERGVVCAVQGFDLSSRTLAAAAEPRQLEKVEASDYGEGDYHRKAEEGQALALGDPHVSAEPDIPAPNGLRDSGE